MTSVEIAIAEAEHLESSVQGPIWFDQWKNGELAQAAAGYALNAAPGNITTSLVKHGDVSPWFWPVGWKSQWWEPSPSDRVQELAKGVALMLHEMDRLIRKQEQDERQREVGEGTASTIPE